MAWLPATARPPKPNAWPRSARAGLYKALNLTWDEFCQQHAGASRAHIDEMIRQLKEFGAAYFRLSEIIRISPQSYRMIGRRGEG